MTPDQFARAVKVAGVDINAPVNIAASKVLLYQWTQSQAAKWFDINRSAVLRAVKRIQAAAKACPCCGRAF